MIISEYIFLDNEGTLRSKTRTLFDLEDGVALQDIPIWEYDETRICNSTNTYIKLVPKKIYRDPFRKDGVLVWCGPIINLEEGINIRFRQELLLCDRQTNRPLGANISGIKYKTENITSYCSIGAKITFGRGIMEKFYKYGLNIGLKIENYNSSDNLGQWQYLINSHDLWISRYILNRICEDNDVYMTLKSSPEENYRVKNRLELYYSDNNTNDEINGLNHIMQMIDILKQNHNKQYPDENFNYNGDIGSLSVPKTTFLKGFGYFIDRRIPGHSEPISEMKKFLNNFDIDNN